MPIQDRVLRVFVQNAQNDALEALKPEASEEQMKTAIKHQYVAIDGLKREIETLSTIIEQYRPK